MPRCWVYVRRSSTGTSTEDLPWPDNRVTVDRDGKLTLSYSETNAEAKKQLCHKLQSLLGGLTSSQATSSTASRT